MTGGMSGGHFVGFFAAVLGLAALVVVATRHAMIQRLGSMRWPAIATAILALILLAFFGSGSREITFRTAVGPSAGVLPRITQAHVDSALVETVRLEFVQYVAHLEGAASVENPERISRALVVRAGTTVDLKDEGYRVDPPPPLGQAWLFASYADRENAMLAMLRSDAGAGRMVVAERIVTGVLPQAAAIAALRMATTDDEKLAILRENPFVMPYAAEWIAAELDKLAMNASPVLASELRQKRVYVQKYIDDPTARGLASGMRADAP
jgi:hypothetical protein